MRDRRRVPDGRSMPDRERVETAIRALAGAIAVPPPPSLADRVASRILADGAASARPPLPRRALWTRRTRLVLAVVAVLALLAVAAGARFAIGAIEVRVVPSATPSAPPFDPGQLGRPATVEQVAASVAFDVALPAGRAPDAAYVSRSGDDAAIFAWEPDGRSPVLPGTPWGLVLIELTSAPGEELVKGVSGFQDTEEVALDGRRAFWIHRPHELLVITDEGDERFLVEGNVLVWERAGVTYRLETPLALEDALATARTIA